MEKSLEKILKERIFAEDREAFAALFKLFFPKVFTFIRMMVGSGTVAEDLTQDLFVKIWDHRRRLPGINDLDSYIFRMAKNASLDHLRLSDSRNVSLDMIADDSLLAYVENSDERLSAAHKMGVLREALSNMPPQRRKIFVMSRFFGLPNSRIAQTLGLSKRTVENQIALANKDLEKIAL